MQLAPQVPTKTTTRVADTAIEGCFMDLAGVLHLDQPAGDLGRSEMDETSAMVFLGDIYSVLLLAGTWDKRSTSEPDAMRRAPLDSVWPFIR